MTLTLEVPRTVEDLIEREIASGMPMGPFHRRWLLQRAPEKVKRDLEMARLHPHLYMMPRQGFLAPDINDINTSDFNARNTFTTEVNLLGGDANGAPSQGLINQFCAISPNDARAGKAYLLKFGGIHSTTGTPTIIFTPRWGSHVTIGTNVILGVSQTLTTGSGVSAQPFYGEFLFGIKTSPPGATAGTGKGHGFVAIGTATTTAAVVTMGKTLATIDTTGQGTAGCGLQMGVTWSASSASNTITPENWIIFSVN
jgi:hypothetical protein